MKKKILYIVEGFGGGVYSFITELANGLSDEFDITLAYSRRSETPADITKDFDNRIKMVELKNTRNINIIQDTLGALKIRKLLKDEKPDILHLHSSKAGFMGRIMVNTLELKHNCKVFYNPHGFSFLQSNISKTKRNIYFLLERLATLFGGTIVCVSEGELNEAKKLSQDAKKINNCINVENIKCAINKKNVNDETNNIATLARISYQKDPRTFNEIAKKMKHLNFTWIGDGELKEELTESNIDITGWKDNKDAINELNKCDIFILTSLWEGMPIALLEAMSLGKVCIVSNVVGNRDVVIDGVNGFIANNIDDFVKYINLVVEDKNLYKKISTNAINYIEKNYDIKTMINKYKKLYLKEMVD